MTRCPPPPAGPSPPAGPFPPGTWRRLPVPRRDEDPRPLSSSLDSLARSLGAPPPRALDAVFARWEDVVGPALAAHAHPVSARDGTLVVIVDHPSWATEVRWLGAGLLDRLGEVAGTPVASRIEVRVRGERESRG
ncbi:MAG: DciA family protein [Acidimicrobiales bacterium]